MKLCKNKIIENNTKPNNAKKQLFLGGMNSYLSILGYYKSYKLRKLYVSNKLSKKWLLSNPNHH